MFQISLDHIRKADVVAQTKIVYKEKELLQLMYDHLMQVRHVIMPISHSFVKYARCMLPMHFSRLTVTLNRELY